MVDLNNFKDTRISSLLDGCRGSRMNLDQLKSKNFNDTSDYISKAKLLMKNAEKRYNKLTYNKLGAGKTLLSSEKTINFPKYQQYVRDIEQLFNEIKDEVKGIWSVSRKIASTYSKFTSDLETASSLTRVFDCHLTEIYNIVVNGEGNEEEAKQVIKKIKRNSGRFESAVGSMLSRAENMRNKAAKVDTEELDKSVRTIQTMWEQLSFELRDELVAVYRQYNAYLDWHRPKYDTSHSYILIMELGDEKYAKVLSRMPLVSLWNVLNTNRNSAIEYLLELSENLVHLSSVMCKRIDALSHVLGKGKEPVAKAILDIRQLL